MSPEKQIDLTADFHKKYIEPLCQLGEKSHPIKRIDFRFIDGKSGPYGIEFNKGQYRDSCLLIPQTTPDGTRRVFFVNNDIQQCNLSEFILASITKRERQFFININNKRKMPNQILYDEGEYFDFTDKNKILHSIGNIYMHIKESDLSLVFQNHSLTTLYYPFDNKIKNLLKSGERLLNNQKKGTKKTR